MTANIKTVKFNGTFKDSEGKPISTFLKNIVNKDGIIKQSFYWLEYRALNQKSIIKYE